MEESLPISVSLRERLFSPQAIGGVGLAVLFCLFHRFMGGFMLAHLFFAALVIGLYLVHPASRQLVLLASPLLFKEVIFDFLRYIPFAWLQPIHVAQPYLLDRALFGITCGGSLMPINECMMAYANGFWDMLFGLVYLLLEPVAYLSLILLWRLKSTETAQRYAAAFLLMNLFAFVTYVFYPAAAPWYVNQHGFTAPVGAVLGNAAGLGQLDSMLGTSLSANIYGASPFVFGAIPSMHAGITMIGFLYFLQLKKRWSVGMGLYVLVMWVGALYLQHHYLIDVLLGILYALVAYMIVEKGLGTSVNRGHQWLQKYLDPDSGSY